MMGASRELAELASVTTVSSGNVGIGTSSPGAKLHVSQGNTSVGALFNGTTRAIRFGFDTTGSIIEGVDNTGVTSFQPLTVGGADVRFTTSATERARIDSSGNVLVTGGGGLGYGTGAGGTVTQATSKATAVTLNKPTGQITMNNAALAAGATTGFQFNNSLIASTDIVVVTVNWSASSQAYEVWIGFTGSGNCGINLRNRSGGSLSDAVVINFAIIKGVTS